MGHISVERQPSNGWQRRLSVRHDNELVFFLLVLLLVIDPSYHLALVGCGQRLIPDRVSSLRIAYPRTTEKVPPSFRSELHTSCQLSDSQFSVCPSLFGSTDQGKRCFDFRSLTIFRGIAHRAVFVALSFVRSSRRQEQLTTLLPGLASSGLTSNRHSLLVRVDEVQGYQGGQVVPAQYGSVRCR